MDREQQRRIVEAVVLTSPEPIAPTAVAELIPRCNPSQVRALVKELNEEYQAQQRAFEIWEVAGGFQFRSLPEFAPYLKQIQKTRPLRLSQAALETLSIVAYRQPVTRAEVEQVRGVDVGAVLRSLLDRGLVRIAGHREVAGRPIVYATTRRFLEVFGLAKLGDLPALRDLADLAGPEGGEDDEEGQDAARPAAEVSEPEGLHLSDEEGADDESQALAPEAATPGGEPDADVEGERQASEAAAPPLPPPAS